MGMGFSITRQQEERIGQAVKDHRGKREALTEAERLLLQALKEPIPQVTELALEMSRASGCPIGVELSTIAGLVAEGGKVSLAWGVESAGAVYLVLERTGNTLEIRAEVDNSASQYHKIFACDRTNALSEALGIVVRAVHRDV